MSHMKRHAEAFDDAVVELARAKEFEVEAIEKRKDAEAKLFGFLESEVDLGSSKTINYGFNNDLEGEVRIAVSRPVYRRLDREKWNEIAPTLSQEQRDALVRSKPEAIDKGWRELMVSDRAAYNVASAALTTSAGKPSVRVTVEREEG